MRISSELKVLQKIPFLDRRSLPPKQLVSELWEDRRRISERDMNLFCWQRPINQLIQSHLQTLIQKELPVIRFQTQDGDLEKQIEKVKPKWYSEPTMASELFWKDVLNISKDFLKYSQDGTGIVHLKVVDNDSCRKFHIDGYSLRLFTTYLGPGTEWLPEKAVDRSALGKTNELIVKDSSLIQRMNSFDVGILKGQLPNRSQRVKGIVHRSPQISKTGEKRLILRVDI